MPETLTKKQTKRPSNDDLDWMVRNVIIPYQKRKEAREWPTRTSTKNATRG